MEENALTVQQLMDWLNISQSKAYELATDPFFPKFRVGRAYRFWPSEVREYFQRMEDLRDPWKQSPQSLGRRRRRDGDASSRARLSGKAVDKR
ncbi:MULTISPECIES: helix-turn-helix domain-containing protein [unclassified Curtobacterium]|uniref:helix-turn-helix domain-containing protein n=1 Tax=unclassified Curtobacterium TaxID=257496 RepID=UPI003A7F782F